MKRICLLALLAVAPLSAQTGDGAVASQTEVQNNAWQSWAFAGGAAIATGVGIVLVAINAGHTAH